MSYRAAIYRHPMSGDETVMTGPEQDYLRGDDSARGRNEPERGGSYEDFQRWKAYRDGWMAAYMDKFNRKQRRKEMVAGVSLDPCSCPGVGPDDPGTLHMGSNR